MSTICTGCSGKGRKRIGFFQTKVCSICHGKGYVKSEPIPDQPNSFSGTRIYKDDVIIRTDLVSIANHQSREEFSGHGGAFAGAGASGYYDAPVSQPDSDSSSSSGGD